MLLPARLAEVGKTRSEVLKSIKSDYPKHLDFVKSLMGEYGLPDVEFEDGLVLSTSHIQEQVQVVLEERVPLFAAGLGDPSQVVPLAREQGIKVLGLVGSVRNALRQVNAGVDVVVAQGTEAVATQESRQFSPDSTSCRCRQAYSGGSSGWNRRWRGIAAALSLGAVGVWVGTAFLAAEESAIFEAHKQEILRGSSEDFVVSKAYSGKTARDYKNVVIDAWDRSGLDTLPMPLQRVLMQNFVKSARMAGRYDLVNNPAGQIAGMINERKPAAQIMEELVQGAVEVLQGLQRSVTI